MNKLIVIANEKGGVGKTNTSLVLSYVLKTLDKDFRLIEIDDSQNSYACLSKSVLKENLLSIDSKNADEELYKALFELLQEDNKTIVVDAGGSENTRLVIEMVKKLAYENTKWLIPIQNSKKQQQNIFNTFNLIDDPDNTHIVKNQVIKEKKYMFFEGDQRLGQPSIRKKLGLKTKVFEIEDSELFEIPESNEQTIYDAADLAKKYTKTQAREIFLKNNDPIYFVNMMNKFSISEDSLALLDDLKREFEDFLNE